MNSNVSDNELMSMLGEDEDNVKDIIYDRYNYLIDVIIRKYMPVIKMFQIDEDEIRCEASYGFSDGLNSFSDNKNASLKTFLTMCIERRVQKCIKKHTTVKSQIYRDAVSIDDSVANGFSLEEIISDDRKNLDPLNNLTEEETYLELINIAKEVLSDQEYRVFGYMLKELSYQDIAKLLDKTPKQIDNTIQRIKQKLKKEIQK